MKTGIVAFLAGIMLLFQLAALPGVYWAFLIIPLLALLLIRSRLRLIICIALGFLYALFRADLILQRQLPLELEATDIVVEGIIIGIPRQSSRRLQFEFKVDQLDSITNQLVRNSMFRLNWYDDFPQINPGEKWQLMVRVKKPNGFMNPGNRDYEASLFQQGINASGYVKQGEKRAGSATPVVQKIHHLRQTLYVDLQHSNKKLNAVIPALGLGIRDDLTSEMWDVLTGTGTTHLMAISGLHIGLIAALAFFIGRWAWSLPVFTLHWIPAQKMGVVFAMCAALAYTALAGFSIPTQRALIMVLVIMMGLFFNRQLSRFDVFFMALLAVLLFSPAAVLTAGFWLSFAAVAIIFYVVSGRTKSIGIWHRHLRIHFIIALGLVPLTLLFFGQNPLMAPLANIIAVPLIGGLVTPLVLLGMMFLKIYQPLGILIISFADQLIDTFWPFLEWLNKFQSTHLHVPQMSQGLVISTLSGIILLLMPRGLPGRWLGGIFLLPVLLIKLEGPATNEFEFTLLDVGQGLSAVIRTEHHTMLYDTGPKFSADFDTGQAVVIPFLKSIGIDILQKVIISHGDNDHIGGYNSLIKDVDVHETLTSVPEKLEGVSVVPCKKGQQWQWDGVTFTILHPNQETYANGNNRSCVLKVDNGLHSVLLTGDIEAAAELDLLKQGIDLDADILVVPHHGSNTSSTAAFIDAVSPEYALFPAGYRNRYHFPVPSVIERYRNSDIQLLDTASSGAIRFNIGSEIATPVRYRLQEGHFWNRNNVK